MIRLHGIFSLGIVTACLIVPAGLWAGTNDAASTAAAKPAKAAAPTEIGQTGRRRAGQDPGREAEPSLPPRSRQTAAAWPHADRGTAAWFTALAMHQKQPLNTRENSATEITSYCLAFGCGSEILYEGADGNRVNGITCLCWGYPCAGFELLGLSGDHVAAQIGYGCQEHPGEFLAMLAMARVADKLPAPRRPPYPQRGRRRRIREAELPPGRRPVAETARTVVLRRGAAVEERPRRNLVARPHDRGGTGPTGGHGSQRAD